MAAGDLAAFSKDTHRGGIWTYNTAMVEKSRKTKVSNDEAGQMARLFVMGHSMAQIAARMGRDRSTVYALIKRLQLDRPRGLHDVELAVIEQQLARIRGQLDADDMSDAAMERLEMRLVRLTRERRLLLAATRSDDPAETETLEARDAPEATYYEDEARGIRVAVPHGWWPLNDAEADMDDGAGERPLPDDAIEHKSRSEQRRAGPARMGNVASDPAEYGISGAGPPGAATGLWPSGRTSGWHVAPMVVHGRARQRQNTGRGRMATPHGAVWRCWPLGVGGADAVRCP